MIEKEMIPPAHLNEDCLQKALEKACNTNNIKLKFCEFKLANISGGNFCSNIYRINGSYRIFSTEPPQLNLEHEVEQGKHKMVWEENFNFIIKDMIMDIAEIGTNELSMFENILPEMLNILNEVQSIEINTETSNKLAASCFFTKSNEDYEFYIFEDLNALGYSLGNRCEGLSENQAKLALEKLAKFHAASMVYNERFPNTFDALNSSHFAEGAMDSIAKAITQNGMNCAMEIFKTFDQEIVMKMQKIAAQFNEKVKRIVNPNESTFNVLNHGDLWVNNILFQAQDAVFVDFQSSFWASPAYDLNYFLYTSLPLKILQTERYQLLHHYYKILKLTLENLKFTKIPRWSDLLKEIRRGALIGYYAALCEMPICCMNEKISLGFTAKSFHDSKKMRSLIFENPKVYQFIWYAVLHFEEIGLFND